MVNDNNTDAAYNSSVNKISPLNEFKNKMRGLDDENFRVSYAVIYS